MRSLIEPLNLTFGIEVECFLKVERELYRKHEQKYRGAFKTLKTTLNNASVSATTELEKTVRGYDRWTICRDTSLKPSYDEDALLYESIDVELVSPVLRCGRSKDYAEVKATVGALKSAHTLTLNKHTGFHVHIGNGRSGTLPFQCCKTVALLHIAFERVINSIVPPWRLHSPWAMPPSCARAVFWDDYTEDGYRELTVGDHLDMIAACADMDALIARMSGDEQRNRRVQISFLALKSHRTLEFRLFAGTLDAEEMLLYVDFCTALVRFAGGLEDAQLFLLLKRWIKYLRRYEQSGIDPFEFGDFLRLISADELCDGFEKLARKREAMGNWEEHSSPTGSDPGDWR